MCGLVGLGGKAAPSTNGFPHPRTHSQSGPTQARTSTRKRGARIQKTHTRAHAVRECDSGVGQRFQAGAYIVLFEWVVFVFVAR